MVQGEGGGECVTPMPQVRGKRLLRFWLRRQGGVCWGCRVVLPRRDVVLHKTNRNSVTYTCTCICIYVDPPQLSTDDTIIIISIIAASASASSGVADVIIPAAAAANHGRDDACLHHTRTSICRFYAHTSSQHPATPFPALTLKNLRHQGCVRMHAASCLAPFVLK